MAQLLEILQNKRNKKLSLLYFPGLSQALRFLAAESLFIFVAFTEIIHGLLLS